MVGAFVGFLFTSYGEEAPTVGKLRDWLIAGIAGITIAQAGKIKGLLAYFQVGEGGYEFGIVVGVSVLFLGMGFFFMYFQRELILNVWLAETRVQRSRIEGTRVTGLVIQKISDILPLGLLSGVDDIEDIIQISKDEAERIKASLYDEQINAFVSQVEDLQKSGVAMDWDVISKVAYIHYYRTYFEKDKKATQIEIAEQWAQRALVMNPLHADLTMKYADILGMREDYEGAVAVLERLSLHEDAPMLVHQWLGYFLLFVPGQEMRAISHSETYLSLFPSTADALFNLACAYAQIYCGSRKRKYEMSPESAKAKALEFLSRGLDVEPEYKDRVEGWTERNESFECFKNDDQFKSIMDSVTEQTGSAHSQDDGTAKDSKVGHRDDSPRL